jgi:hypothetical protein
MSKPPISVVQGYLILNEMAEDTGIGNIQRPAIKPPGRIGARPLGVLVVIVKTQLSLVNHVAPLFADKSSLLDCFLGQISG